MASQISYLEHELEIFPFLVAGFTSLVLMSSTPLICQTFEQRQFSYCMLNFICNVVYLCNIFPRITIYCFTFMAPILAIAISRSVISILREEPTGQPHANALHDNTEFLNCFSTKGVTNICYFSVGQLLSA